MLVRSTPDMCGLLGLAWLLCVLLQSSVHWGEVLLLEIADQCVKQSNPAKECIHACFDSLGNGMNTQRLMSTVATVNDNLV